MKTLNDLFAIYQPTPDLRRKPTAKKSKGKKGAAKTIAVLDYETDPFKYGRVPEPFCLEFYSDGVTEQFWGDDCTEQFIAWLEKQETEYLIYAHNGGKFDFHFLFKYISDPALIIKTRIVECQLFQHTLVDSFAIIPIPLRQYEKMEFDYALMERPLREKHKAAILEYLHSDCVYLFDLVSAFIEEFGLQMTVGGTAMGELIKFHPYQKQGADHDALFRPFYYGGHVEAFRGGILKGPWKIVDINSAYPNAMRNKKHPRNGRFMMRKTLPDNFDMPYFVEFEGRNFGALPSVAEDGGLVFDKESGYFRACSHELEVALEYGLVEIDKIISCYVSSDAASFDEFVDFWYARKEACKRSGDKRGEIFAKFMLNSAYGRFGINPENFSDWRIHRDFGNDDDLREDGYVLEVDYPDIELWSRKADIRPEMYCDVSTAASITSATRAQLLRGLQDAVDPIYCDTDSIICRDFNGDMDPYRLGAWDLEKTGEYMAIGGKKLYALFNDFSDEKALKLSSKGGTLSLQEVLTICRGESVRYENMAPTFSLKQKPRFVHRNFKMTVAAGK